MKSTGDQKQEFNTTLFLAIALAALLGVGLLGLFYGCMENNQSSGSKPHAELRVLHLTASNSRSGVRAAACFFLPKKLPKPCCSLSRYT